MNSLIESAFPFIFGAIILFMIYQFISKKGFRGLLFGAEVINTLGEVKGIKRGSLNTVARVHTLKGDDCSSDAIGIEIVAKSFASARITALSLSTNEAKRLANLLNEAVNK